MKCPNCTMPEFVPLPHNRYVLTPLDEATGQHGNGGIPLIGDMCKKCGYVRLFSPFKPQT